MLHDIEELEADIPPEALAVLADARDAYSERGKAEAALHAALELAPDNLALRVAAYKFFFYANRLDQALPHAEACLAMAGDALALPRNWCVVTSDSARFAGFDRPQRIYLQSLIAIGYCRARLGDTESGEALLRQAARLDPQDRMGAGRLADVVARGGIDDEE